MEYICNYYIDHAAIVKSKTICDNAKECEKVFKRIVHDSIISQYYFYERQFSVYEPPCVSGNWWW